MHGPVIIITILSTMALGLAYSALMAALRRPLLTIVVILLEVIMAVVRL